MSCERILFSWGTHAVIKAAVPSELLDYVARTNGAKETRRATCSSPDLTPSSGWRLSPVLLGRPLWIVTLSSIRMPRFPERRSALRSFRLSSFRVYPLSFLRTARLASSKPSPLPIPPSLLPPFLFFRRCGGHHSSVIERLGASLPSFPPSVRPARCRSRRSSSPGRGIRRRAVRVAVVASFAVLISGRKTPSFLYFLRAVFSEQDQNNSDRERRPGF